MPDKDNDERPSIRQNLSLFAQHIDRWKHGCGAEICEFAQRKCFARGSLPCDVLFAGEAPGESEDMIGSPFVGPAGKLLDRIVKSAIAPGLGLRTAFTNLVLCIPRELEESASGKRPKAGQPDDDSVRSCMPRLEEFIRIADGVGTPTEGCLKAIICVGTLARDYFDKDYRFRVRPHRDIATTWIYHPAFILRASQVQQGLLLQRAIVTVTNVIEEALGDV